MQDIRFLDTDGEILILEGDDGLKFRLLIDETLRKAIRHDPTLRLDSSAISPREIQNEVRNGASITDLVSRTGAPENYIEKFAAPVLDELKHIVASALSVRITIAGDRYNESNQVEFGDIIKSRLQSSGASEADWTCKRTEADGWLLSCVFELNGSRHQAVWHFVPRRLALSPENETAVSLSSPNSLTENPIAKLHPVSEPYASRETAAEPFLETATETGTVTELIPQIVSEAEPASNLTANLAETLEFEGVIPFGRSKPTEKAEAEPVGQNESDDELPLSETADLLEALRLKRISRESDSGEQDVDPKLDHLRSVSSFDPDVEESFAESVLSNADSNAENAQLTDFDLETEHTGTGFTEEVEPVALKPTANYKKGRPSIPSWDEIVFGSNKQDE